MHDSSFLKHIDPRVSQKTDLYLMTSSVSVKDGIYDILDLSQVEYTVIEEQMRQDHYSLIDPIEETSSLIEISLRLSTMKRVYKREVDDVLTYLGDLGGLLDVLLVMGQILTSLVAHKLFTAALIGKLYRVQEYMRDFTQYYTTKAHLKLTSESEESSSNFSSDEDSSRSEKKLGVLVNNSNSASKSSFLKNGPHLNLN